MADTTKSTNNDKEQIKLLFSQLSQCKDNEYISALQIINNLHNILNTVLQRDNIDDKARDTFNRLVKHASEAQSKWNNIKQQDHEQQSINNSDEIIDLTDYQSIDSKSDNETKSNNTTSLQSQSQPVSRQLQQQVSRPHSATQPNTNVANQHSTSGNNQYNPYAVKQQFNTLQQQPLIVNNQLPHQHSPDDTLHHQQQNGNTSLPLQQQTLHNKPTVQAIQQQQQSAITYNPFKTGNSKTTQSAPTVSKSNDVESVDNVGSLGIINKPNAHNKRHRPDSTDNSDDDEQQSAVVKPPFMTASDKYSQELAKKNRNKSSNDENDYSISEPQTKRLGFTGRRNAIPAFKNPLKQNNNNNSSIDNIIAPSFVKKALKDSTGNKQQQEPQLPERLKGCDPKLVELIMNEMMETSDSAQVRWDDIAGLEFAKKSVQEIVIWPMKKPEMFTGLRAAPKGILLFGPPGTGKTLIGKAIASEAGAKFFNISASSLTSKWHGEGEKLMRTLFAVAGYNQPSIIFIDEIDSLLTQRNESEYEASRRLKTEFLVQFDGVGTNSNERVLVVGATNRPQELDEAARRRLVKRLYIPLPDKKARKQLINILLNEEPHELTDNDIDYIVESTEGYSGADIRALCTEAAYGPIRSLGNITDIDSIQSVPPIRIHDFDAALKQVRASVSKNQLKSHVEWNQLYGSIPNDPAALADKKLAERNESPVDLI